MSHAAARNEVRGTDARHAIDLTPHPDANKLDKGDKVVYYQTNPLPNWGPAARAKTVKAGPGADAAVQSPVVQAQVQAEVTAKAKAEPASGLDAQKRKADTADGAPTEKKAKVVDEAREDEEDAMNMA